MIINGKYQNSGERLKEQRLLSSLKNKLSALYPHRKLVFTEIYTCEKTLLQVDLSPKELSKEALLVIQQAGGEYQPEQYVWIHLDRPKAWPMGVWAVFYFILYYTCLYVWWNYAAYFQFCHTIGYSNCTSLALTYMFKRG